MFFLTPKNASKARLREAENARKNRQEIIAARSQGKVSRRDLIKMGIMTAGGAMALKNGLSPFARSAFAQVPTGVCSSSAGLIAGSTPFTFPMLRLHNLKPHPLTPVPGAPGETDLLWPAGALTGAIGDELRSMRRANTTGITHTVNLAPGSGPTSGPFGPREGRPPGEPFAHQRWNELLSADFLKASGHAVGFVVSHGQLFTGFRFKLDDPNWAVQGPSAVWTFGEGRFVRGGNWVPGGDVAFPALLQARYGETVILRNYNNLPFFDPFAEPFPNAPNNTNGGFGRQEPTTHNHNAHNGAESDGAGNAHFFPGQYYDYLWSTMLARHDFTKSPGLLAKINAHQRLDGAGGYGLKAALTDPRASTPTNDGKIIRVPGDFREIQGTMWFHDHRIAFTSENVYKGYAALLEYFSGPDRGYEKADLATAEANNVNLRYPSGFLNGKTWGNRDFDVYFLVQDVAFDKDGQLCFDVFDTDGFLGDVIHVNFQWKPFFEVLKRRYRFRILSAGMSRWVQLAIADKNGKACPIAQIANDGNLFPKAVRNLTQLDIQATAERYDIFVDFDDLMKKGLQPPFYLVNLLQFSNGRKPDKTLSLAEALSGTSPDPAVGKIMEFRVVDKVMSVDDVNPDGTPKGTMLSVTGLPGTVAVGVGPELRDPDAVAAADPAQGTSWQIPPVVPDRTRVIELVRDGSSDSGLPFDHPDGPEPWAVTVNGGTAHQTDMRRASNLPMPGDIEHWVYSSGGGWGHPLHLHFEEAITLNRNQGPRVVDSGGVHPAEFLKRKDVWHIGAPQGSPTVQTVFSEFGGAYVNHCHNTVHEDNAMLIHYHLIRGNNPDSVVGNIDAFHATVMPTPDPRPEGVTYVEACFLPEGNLTFSGAAEIGADACPPNEVGPVVPVVPQPS